MECLNDRHGLGGVFRAGELSVLQGVVGRFKLMEVQDGMDVMARLGRKGGRDE